ncbi:hypothetical protein L484_017352 [Morus notabilis]|uniref:Uncharacterized protein n=1 Tax=Morus notabilis TaxID=981085 RepID=W9RGH9_9ROSA|nr:hypothetical protein L484_017352 [Morus notabilis]
MRESWDWTSEARGEVESEDGNGHEIPRGGALLCFSMKRMRSAIIFEAQRGYWSALGRNMRFNYFLYSKYSKICYRSKHKLVEKLVEEVDGYGLSNLCNRPKVLDKVSVMMGYDGLPDLIENGTDCFDVSLVRNRFPSIIVGSSPPVSLYDGTWDLCDRRSLLAVKGYEDFLSNSTSKEQMLNSLNETCDSPDSTFSSVETSSSRECYSYTTPLVSEPITLVPEENLNQPVTLEGSYALESQVNETPIELFLDKAISCIQGLRKKHCHQLEDAGFHTFRKVLHHFPRTYADLRNAQMGIEDGQYLIFIGKIVSSRGVRANSSFSFLEVVVSCDIANCDSNSENRVDSTDIEGNKTIYLHLKKFFRAYRVLHYLKGTPGIGILFKRNGGVVLEAYTDADYAGSIVDMWSTSGYCTFIGGNLVTWRSKKHNVVARSSAEAEFRAMAQGVCELLWLKIILEDLKINALQALPLNIDPIPEKVIQEFGLANLYDAYTGIHQPKSINEADLARKRLIFDEFFYLQLGRLFQMLEGLGTQIEKDGLLDKYRKPESNASYMREWSSITKKIVKTLPYSLTSSQLKAVSEIIWDLKQPVPMNRLLQAAFMVPTELLAIQHYDHLNNLLESMEEVECKPSIALLTGSTPLKQSRMIRKVPVING